MHRTQGSGVGRRYPAVRFRWRAARTGGEERRDRRGEEANPKYAYTHVCLDAASRRQLGCLVVIQVEARFSRCPVRLMRRKSQVMGLSTHEVLELHNDCLATPLTPAKRTQCQLVSTGVFDGG